MRRRTHAAGAVVLGFGLLLAAAAQAQQRSGENGPPPPPPPTAPSGGRGMRGMDRPRMRGGPLLAPPGRFWDDPRYARALGLRPEQAQKMDEIFNAEKPRLMDLFVNLQREEHSMRSMSGEEMKDESRVNAAIDRAAAARAELEKANAHLLIQVRRELDARQLQKLDELKFNPPE